MKINSYIKSFMILGLIYFTAEATASAVPCYMKELGGTQPSQLCELRDFLKNLSKKQKKNKPQPKRPASIGNVILLYGPTGTGKTSVARIIAQETGAKLFYYYQFRLVDYSEKSSEEKTIGIIKQIYHDAETQKQPVIIVIDDFFCCDESKIPSHNFDSLCQLRTLRAMWKKYANNPYITTIVITHSNTCDKQTASCVTPIELPLPNQTQRYEIIKFYLANTKHHLSDDFVKNLASKTKKFSGLDIMFMLQRAQMHNEISRNQSGYLEEAAVSKAYIERRKQVDGYY